MLDLPSGTVTLLFTDIEGSTKLLHELGSDSYAQALADHRRLLREAFARHGGVEVDTQGDAFFVVFPTVAGAVAAAAEAQESLRQLPLRIRTGIHTGTPRLGREGYVGPDVHRAARISAAGHGGQVLLSKETRELLARDIELTDLGEHRLKDLPAPVWIFQLGNERFPPLKTISNTNLIRPASSLIGREREVREISSLLNTGARLITLTGPGGIGKTRLAIETAAELVQSFKNGVFMVSLAALRDAGLVAETIGQVLGAKDGLADHIGEREMLLLLDNLEHVVSAAPQFPPLLEACPNLCLLVTSRELLRVRWEQEYQVPPLADAEAGELFHSRSGLPPDETIAELCRRLDHLPLAIELAAARTSVLSPTQILDRLAKRLDLLKAGRDAEARQQTLRATIAWSHDLLASEERRLFALLSVFRGGCSLDAADAVVGADLDILQSLVDKSLLRHTGDRFRMLETIWEYAAERLEGSGEANDTKRRHAAHFLALAEQAEPHLPAYRREWVERLEDEHDNLRAAYDRLMALGEAQPALQLAGALARFWLVRGYLSEGRRRLEDALNADERLTAARAKALVGASMVATDDGPTARLRAEEGLALYQALGDAWGTAQSQLALASSLANEDMRSARELYEASVRGFRKVGDEQYELIATRGLAWACISLGERERGRALHEENLHRARALSNTPIEAITLGALAMHAVEDGRIAEATAMLKESHELHREIGDPLQSAFDVFRFAHILAVEGKEEPAAELLSTADALCQEAGLNLRAWDPEFFDGTMAIIRAKLSEAELREAGERGRRLTAEAAVEAALNLLD